VKLFKELKKQGLNPQNVKWFVDGLNIGTIKIEGVYADFENVKANNQNLRNENENLRNENQNLRYENQELERQIQYNKRMFENDSLAMQKHIVDL
jgi:FtsZ-binding cell division protein ZapB